MALVNKINIANSQISNCDDFAKCFTDTLTNEIEDCSECRVVFDRYDPQSRKIMQDLTEQKKFLLYNRKFQILPEYHSFKRSSSFCQLKQRNELTEYLKKKLAQCMTEEYVIVYGNSLLTNVANLSFKRKRTPALCFMQ